MKLKNESQETDIINVIKKNLLYDTGNKKPEKMAKGEFAKKYATIDKNKDVAPERFHGSLLVGNAEAKLVEKL